jgi:hypothetical protein
VVSPRSRAVAAALAAALALGASAGAAAGADPAERALDDRDVYVDPVVLGARTAGAERSLAREARRLADERRPVKLAIVRGPAGARSMPFYVRRLALRLGYEGTLVATTPTGATAAVGPRATADMTRALRAARVGAISDPLARLVTSARAAAPPPEPEPPRWRPVLILLGIALAGGAWAAAAGMGRRERGERRGMAEARARLRVCLDAMRARAMALARTPGLAPGAREHVQHALGTYAETVASLQETRHPDEVEELIPRVRAGLEELAGAAGIGPDEGPFAGLCAVDPAHGAATGTDRIPDLPEPAPLCAACLAAVEEGRAPARRRLSVDGRPVPFDELDLGAWIASGGARASPG